jgi:NAD(P)-dependent dehydrogenase (short-subunit alcohol dehydrogenase family)
VGDPLAEALRGLDSALPALVTVAPAPVLGPLRELEPAAWRDVFARWCEEPVWAVQAWLRERLARGEEGRWVAVTTNLGTQPFPYGGAVGTAVMALHTVLRVTAVEYGAQGIRANAVAPGWIDERTPPALDEELAVEDTPTARLTSIADVVAAVGWLLSPAAGQVNGEILRLDGGYTITQGSRPSPLTAS